MAPQVCLICGGGEHHPILRECGIDILRCCKCHHVFSSFKADPCYDGFWGGHVPEGEHLTYRKNKATFHAVPPARGAAAPRPPTRRCLPAARQRLPRATAFPPPASPPTGPPAARRLVPALAPAPPWSALGSPRHGAHPPTGPRRRARGGVQD
jgi:hypothetical protein